MDIPRTKRSVRIEAVAEEIGREFGLPLLQVREVWMRVQERLAQRTPGDDQMTEAGAYRLREANHRLQLAHARKVRQCERLRAEVLRLEKLNETQRQVVRPRAFVVDAVNHMGD